MEIQTAAFEKFQREFDRYSEALRKQPEIWRKISAEHNKLAGGFAKLGNTTEAHLDALQDAKDVQEDQEKSLTHSAALWGGIEKASASTTKSLISGTTSLLKWTGLLSGVSGLLGYMTLDGMMHLGSSVYGQRKSAMGLGLTVGQQRAFDIALGPLLGSPQGFLSGINTATTNLASPGYVGLTSLGVNPNGSTSQVAVRTLEAVRALALRTPLNQLGIAEQTYHLGDLGFGLEDFRRFKSMPASQFNSYIGDIGKWQGKLGLSAQSTAAWTKFMMKMEVAGTEIENVFVKGLRPLTGPLANLAVGISHAAAVAMNSASVKRTIADWAHAMNTWTGDLTKPRFIAGMEVLVDMVSSLADIPRAWHWANKPLKPPDLLNPGKAGADARSWWERLWGAQEQWWHGRGGAPIGMLLNNPGNLKFAGQAGAAAGPGGFAQFGSMQGGLDALARQLELYGSRGNDTVQSIVSTYAPASDRNNVPAYIQAIDKELGVTAMQHLNLLDPKVLAELMRAVIRHELGIGVDFNGGISLAARNAAAARAGANIQITNATGGSAIASISALGSSR